MQILFLKKTLVVTPRSLLYIYIYYIIIQKSDLLISYITHKTFNRVFLSYSFER